MGFKENLRSQLQYQGIMVKELAYKTGIAKRTLDNYLSSHNSIPSADMAIKIAQALDTTVEELFNDQNETNPVKYIKIEDKTLIEIINRYKKMNPRQQEALRVLLERY